MWSYSIITYTCATNVKFISLAGNTMKLSYYLIDFITKTRKVFHFVKSFLGQHHEIVWCKIFSFDQFSIQDKSFWIKMQNFPFFCSIWDLARNWFYFSRRWWCVLNLCNRCSCFFLVFFAF